MQINILHIVYILLICFFLFIMLYFDLGVQLNIWKIKVIHYILPNMLEI